MTIDIIRFKYFHDYALEYKVVIFKKCIILKRNVIDTDAFLLRNVDHVYVNYRKMLIFQCLTTHIKFDTKSKLSVISYSRTISIES